jgi:hypothetical protein
MSCSSVRSDSFAGLCGARLVEGRSARSGPNAEHDYIVGELKKNRSIGVVKVYQAGENLFPERVNHCITNGKITLGGPRIK